MKKSVLVFSSILFFCISCNTEQKKKEKPASLTHTQQNTYATYFKIYKEEGFSALVTYINKEKTDSLVYILYSNEKPQLSYNAYYIKAPLKSAAVLDAFFIGALHNLNCLDYITAVDNSDYVYNPIIKKKCGDSKEKKLIKSGWL